MESVKHVAAALIAAKSKFKPVLKNKTNPHYKSKYADLDSVLDAVGSALTEAGLLLIQPTEISESGTVLKTVLIHAESSEILESIVLIPASNDPQKFGSALTYYRRFCLCSLLGIAPEDDDDGNRAIPVVLSKVNPPPPRKDQLSSLPPNDRTNRLKELKTAVIEMIAVLEWDNNKQYQWANKLHGKPSSEWSLQEWSIASVDLQDRIDKEGKAQNLIEAGADY